ncbi:unnamed protein product [Closterium sp. NIES-54]
MEVARTSMIHAAAPHFLWPFAVRYAAHQLNLWPRVSLPETSPTLCSMGEVGDASVFRVCGSRAFVPDTSADKLSSHAIPSVFLGFPPNALGWQFYHPTSRRVLPSQDVMFDESVPFYRSCSLRLWCCWGGAARGAASGGDEPTGAEPGGVEPASAEPAGAEPEGVEPGGAETEGAEPWGADSEGAESGGAEPRVTASAGGPAGAGGPTTGGTGAGGVRATRPGGAGSAGPGGARTGGTREAGTGGVGGTGAGDPGVGGTGAGDLGAGDPGAGGVGTGGARAGGAGAGDPGAGAGDPGAGGAGAGGAGARGAGAGGLGARDPGAGGTGAGGTVQRRPFFVPSSPLSLPPPGSVLCQVLNLASSTGLTPSLLYPPPHLSQQQLQPDSPLPTPSPYAQQTDSLTERREPESRPALPVRTVRTGCRVPCLRPPLVLGTHIMALRPSSVPLRVPLPSPPSSSLADNPDPESDLVRVASPTVPCILATVVTDPAYPLSILARYVAPGRH